MLEKLNNRKFEYKKLTEAEQKARGILGRLVGPCADFVNPTRNGRKYSEQLWENVFNSPIMQEKIKNRCCFGELNHPVDRTEIDMEKVAICLAEQPKKGKDGKLYGVFDILSTPNGRILKALCDYGCNIGISSRGQGDLITDDQGDEAVDPDTYDCECFDAVLVPGVEAARLQYVTESLNTKQPSLTKILNESLESATENERKIMKETLDTLNIINLVEEVDELELPALDDDTDDVDNNVENVDIDGDEETVVTDLELADVATEEGQVESSDEDSTNISDDAVEAESEVIDTDGIDVEADDSDEDSEERSDEEIFLDFLATNFDEDQVKEVCKILEIEAEDIEATKETEVDAAEVDTDLEIDDEKKDTEAAEDKLDSTEEAEDEEASDADIDDDANEAEEPVTEAIDNGAEALVNSLKEALKSKSDLENTVKSLQEKLAVSDAQVNESKEECNRYKTSIARLSVLAKSNKDLKQSNSKLEESLKEKAEIIESQKARISRLIQSRKDTVNSSATKALTENLTKKDDEIAQLNENLSAQKSQINTLTEEFNQKQIETNKTIQTLNEDLKKASAIKEGYRKLATKAVNKYIEVKAEMLGLNSKDIKRKLGESYTIEDVDQVCEDLRSYQLNVSKLPFSIDRKVTVKVNESASNQVGKKSRIFEDDDVDAGLIKLANFD